MSEAIPRKPMHRIVFNNARYYSAGASLLFGNVFSGRNSGDYIAPGILCGTFCIELLFKCLILIRRDDIVTRQDAIEQGIKLDEHLYSKLFDKIDDDLRDRIVATYNSLFDENFTKDQYVELLSKLGDKGFVEWRYVYESGQDKHLDLDLQNRITDSLGKCIEAVYKEKGLQE